jgi:hypothetical protein
MTTEKPAQSNNLDTPADGVKTPSSAAVSRYNAVSHGFFSKNLCLPGEDRSLLNDLRESYLKELQPVGEMETFQVERIISSAWRLKRLVDFECERQERLTHPQPVGDFTPVPMDYGDFCWQDTMRFETALERQIYAARRELERLQRARRQKFLPDSQPVDGEFFRRVPDITPADTHEIT